MCGVLLYAVPIIGRVSIQSKLGGRHGSIASDVAVDIYSIAFSIISLISMNQLVSFDPS